MPRHLLFVLLAVSYLCTHLSTVDATSYTFTTLDVPNAIRTMAFSINDVGQIAGVYDDSSGQHGFLYIDGMFTTLADFPGATGRTVPHGINNSGQIVGSYSFQSGGSHGFLYDHGGFTTLDVPLSGGNNTGALGINDVGEIVGIYGDSSGQHGFLYAAGNFTALDMPGADTGTTRVLGINNSGQIVGSYEDHPPQSAGGPRAHGFLYLDGVFTMLADVPVAGAVNTSPTGINDRGQIVGTYYNTLEDRTHMFLYDTGVFTTFDMPGAATATPVDINNRGQIVGVYSDSSGGTHGFLATLQVTLDIKPGEFPNSINLKSKGKIPVAILTTDTFDATTVKASTVRFGNTGDEAAPVGVSVKDVNADTRPDLLLSFNIQDTGIECGETSASLTGETMREEAIQGADSIVTIGCK
jgi:probable HAF family extracellular repeat protein